MNVLFLTSLPTLEACNSPYMQYHFKLFGTTEKKHPERWIPPSSPIPYRVKFIHDHMILQVWTRTEFCEFSNSVELSNNCQYILFHNKGMNPQICRPSKFCVSGNCREHFSLIEEHSLVKATYQCLKLVGQEKTKMGEIIGFPQKIHLRQTHYSFPYSKTKLLSGAGSNKALYTIDLWLKMHVNAGQSPDLL